MSVQTAPFQFLLCLLQKAPKFGRGAFSSAAWLGPLVSSLVDLVFALSVWESYVQGWEPCSHALTSRPLETCHHQCLEAVCGGFGYPAGAAAELMDGTPELFFCPPAPHPFPVGFLPSLSGW